MIHNIEQDAEFYYELALEKKNKGDFGAALELVREGIGIGYSVKLFIECAELYYKLGAYKDSNYIYHRLFASDSLLEYYLALKRNYFAETGVAGFPLFEFADFDHNFDLEDEQLEQQLQDVLNESLEMMREVGTLERGEGLTYLNMRDVKDGRILVETGELIKNGKFTEAIIKCGELSDDGTYGIEKLSLLASAAYIGEDYALCAETALKLFKRDPENWLAFNLLILIARNGSATLPFSFEELSKRMLDALIKNKDVEKLAEFSRLMGSFQEGELAYAALKTGYDAAPYHPEIIAMFAIRAFLDGHAEKARTIIARGIRLFPENYRIIITHNILNCSNNAKKVGKLLRTGDYTAELYKEFIFQLAEAQLSPKSTKFSLGMLINLNAIMANRNEELIAKALYKIPPRYAADLKRIILRHIVNDDAYPEVKEMLLFLLLVLGGGEEYRVNFFYQGKIIVGIVKTLQEEADNKSFRSAYNMVITKLILHEEAGIDYDVLEEIFSRLKGAGGKPKSAYALAAIMHFEYDRILDGEGTRPRAYYIDNYGTSSKTFNDYLARYAGALKGSR